MSFLNPNRPHSHRHDRRAPSKGIRLIRPTFFVWIIVPLLLWGGHAALGLPHMIWSYEFSTSGNRFDTYADRHYYTCTWVGFYGVFKTNAKNGKCGWVHFFKENDPRKISR